MTVFEGDDQDYFDHPEPTPKPFVEEWYNIGTERGAIQMFIVLEGGGENYGPVFVMPDDNFEQVENRCWIAGHIHSSYDLTIPFKEQTGKY